MSLVVEDIVDCPEFVRVIIGNVLGLDVSQTITKELSISHAKDQSVEALPATGPTSMSQVQTMRVRIAPRKILNGKNLVVAN